MLLIKRCTIQDIEEHLISLGSDNHRDNLESISSFSYFYFIRLDISQFWSLIFLQNDEVLQICPRGEDRKLKEVAKRALLINEPHLSSNWDVIENYNKFILYEPRSEDFQLKPLLLRDAKDSETQYGRWYIQDGSHRSLAYSMFLLKEKEIYRDQYAFCATHQSYFDSN